MEKTERYTIVGHRCH